jgi:hypothetical protein
MPSKLRLSSVWVFGLSVERNRVALPVESDELAFRLKDDLARYDKSSFRSIGRAREFPTDSHSW